MKSQIRHGHKRRISRFGILPLIYLLFHAGSLMAQPITVIIQTPDGAREVCQGSGTFILTAYAEGGNQNFVSYVWDAAPGMLIAEGDYAIFNNEFSTPPGVYPVGVTVTDSEGNTGMAIVNITLKQTPTVTITADGPTAFCDGNSVNLIANPVNGFNFVWRRGSEEISGATQPIYTAYESGNYRVRIIAQNGCFSLSNVIPVTVYELPPVSAGNDGPVCEGSDVQLQGGPDGMVSYAWTSPSNPGFSSTLQNPILPNIGPDEAGEYILTVTDDNGCEDSASTLVVVDEIPLAPISASSSDPFVCSGTEGTMTLTVTGGSGQVLKWYTGSCAGAFIGQGNNLIVPLPTETTTYYVLWESGTCGQSSCASVTVTVTEAPVLSITSTPISCSGEEDATATVNITGGTPPFNVLWSTGATANTIENLGPGTYSVTVTDVAGCVASEEITIVDPEPMVVTITNIVNPECYGEASGEATATVSGGTPPYSYLWSDGQITASATGLAAGTYQVTITDLGGCTATASVTLTDPPQILIEIVSQTNPACYGGSDGSVTVAASNGTEPYTYEWNHGATGPTADNLSAGEYLVTVTDQNGCQATLNVQIIQPDPIEANAGNDQTICLGQTATLTASGGDEYLWSTGETTATIVVSPLETTTYTVTVSDECGEDTDEVTVFVEEGPVVDLGEDIEVCADEEVILDAGFFADSEYFWSTGEDAQAIVVTEGGTYTVTVTNTDNGCSSSDTIEVVINPLPPAETGPDQTICLGQEIILGPEDPVPSPTSTYLWTSIPGDPSLTEPTISNPTVSPTVTTVYTLVETYLDTGCQNENSVTITVVGEAPDPGEDQTICQGESVALGPENPNPGSTYYWASTNPEEEFDDQVPNPVVTPQITTTYTLYEVVGECTFFASVTITVNPSPEADAGTDKEICFGEGIMIGPDNFEPNPASTFFWTSVPEDPSISDPTISNPIVNPQVTTVYTLTETFIQTGCSNQNSITVTVHELPDVVIAEDMIICEGEAVAIGDPEAPEGNTYEWTSEPEGFESTDSNPTVSPQITTTYFVTVTSTFGCEASGQVTISVYPAPVAQVSDDIVFCSESEIEPVFIGGEAVDGYTYSWTSDPEGFTSSEANPLVQYTGTTPITYFLIVTSELGCTAEYSVTISLSDLILTVDNPEICDNEETLFLGAFITVEGGSQPYQYQWFDDQSALLSESADYVAFSPFLENYIVVVTDANGCMRMETIHIVLKPTPQVSLEVTPPDRAYFGQTITFTALPGNYDNYEFFVDGIPVQNGTSNIFRSSELKDGQVVYVVASLDGCTGQSEPYTVKISGLPNAFTPDNDGINDIFGKDHKLIIFNRWGQAVFEGTEGWDGTHNGRNVSPGTYYYILEIFDHNNQKTVIKGSVTVIRHRE